MVGDPIKHVVVLMLENHSFDQMLGCMHSVYPGLDGIDPKSPGVNEGPDGTEYFQEPNAAFTVRLDPRHEYAHVMSQLADGNGGFVMDLANSYSDAGPTDFHSIMDYFPRGSLPALHTLAENFAICDRWFSSVPGPTWANRFFAHSGTSMGRVEMPESRHDAGKLFAYFQQTIYDRFDAAGIKWHIYFGDIPQSAVMLSVAAKFDRLRPMSMFYQHTSRAEVDFPQYAFIEPRYYAPDQNDDHPPHVTVRSQELLASVYNAIRANEELWNSTLLVVLYDEHGGFYDHVEPGTAVPPDDHNVDGCKFDRLGVRVPALLVSPWIERQVVSTDFDHSSLLRYLTDKFALPHLTKRDQAANSFAFVIRRRGSPRRDTPTSIVMPPSKTVVRASSADRMSMMAMPQVNEHQAALIATVEAESNRIASGAAPERQAVRVLSMTDSAEDAKAKFQEMVNRARKESGQD